MAKTFRARTLHTVFAALGLALAAPALAQPITVQTLTSADPALAMPPVTAPDGKVFNYSLGIGSGAFRHPSDPADVIWTIGDRGPNMVCSEARALIGADIAETCAKLRNGRVYPTPGYAPSIYRVALDRTAGTFRLLETIPLRTRTSGRPVRGLLNPQTKAAKDTSIDLAGKALADDPDNVDLEGIVRLADGTFWISEEMGPSLAHVAADGRILKRLVPADAAEDYKGSEAEIVPSLPAILSKRQGNRGFESLAISPDERFLYVMMQNPLANPNTAAFNAARNARLFKLERETGRLVGEWIYQLDDPRSFGLDPSERQSDPRISEMAALDLDRLLVLERTEGTTKLHEITLAGATDILGSRWDDVATAPSLEQQNDLAPLGLTPVSKTLRFDTARDARDAPGKIEGVAFLGDGALALINDNDFGIRGDATKVLIVRGAVTPAPIVHKR
jgi:hypothetical protein